jgi:UDP:flavonoid glycosyltransferase YjiC (YdhE family)
MSRFLLAAFGDPGHAFPAIALGGALTARGHEVWLETWTRWGPEVEAAGMRMVPAAELPPFPTEADPVEPYAFAAFAARRTRALVRDIAPAVVVADILTLGAGLAAELEGRPWATLVPHLLPTHEPGLPPFSSGARRPRWPVGRAAWRVLDPLWLAGARLGKRQLNAVRTGLGLPPLRHLHGGISRQLALVATFPQLEYPRKQRAPWVTVTGPLLWEPPAAEAPASEGDGPLVLVAPSTSQDRGHRLLAASLEALADESVRVLAATGPHPVPRGVTVPGNARVFPWLSYARTMPACAVVVCHGGHGTVARALASGAPVVVCPAAGDMTENGARVSWAGVGVSVPRRLASPRGIRLAVRAVMADPGAKRRAEAIAAWSTRHDGAEIAADEVERFAAGPRPGAVVPR